MGLLDDAIREHLDLKRQRGADPGEIERLEREALGPVRRERSGRGVDATPQLEAYADPMHDSEPATELLHDAGPTRAPKRGFLRRTRSAPTSQPSRSDFTEHLDSGMFGDPGESHRDLSEHPDPFGQDEFDRDDPFPNDEPATHEHAAPSVTAQSPSVTAPPDVEAEPPHLILDTAPPRRPRFAPAPPSTTEPRAESAPVDAAGLESEAEAAPPDAARLEPEPEERAAATVEQAAPLEPSAPAPAPDDHARSDAARETREWSVEEAFAAEDGVPTAPAADPGEEDVLEETPEFLQDTPDHDRLWFEQRPPRDFDFDG